MLSTRTAGTTEHRKAVLLLLGAALSWSLGGVLIKNVPWPPLAVAGGRGFIAGLTLLLLVRPRWTRPSPLELAGAVAYAGCTITFVIANKLTTSANAILLQYTAPVYIALLGASFLGEKTSLFDWISIALTLGGMSLFFADGFETAHLAGNLTAVLSGVFFAAMTLLLRRQKHGTPATSLILGNLLAGIVALPALASAVPLAPAGWTSLLLLGVVQLGFSYWLYSRAIRHVTALEAVLIPVLEPILNPVWAGLLLNERPSPLALAGGAVVIVCSLTRTLVSMKSLQAGTA